MVAERPEGRLGVMRDQLVRLCLTHGRGRVRHQHREKEMLQEFKDFISKGNILEVAIGLVMALYFQEVINSLLDGVIYPIIAAIFGEPSFENIGFDIGEARISIGLVINAVISFVIVAFILFLIVKAYNNMQKKDEETAEPTEVELLAEIRDSLRNR